MDVVGFIDGTYIFSVSDVETKCDSFLCSINCAFVRCIVVVFKKKKKRFSISHKAIYLLDYATSCVFFLVSKARMS